SVTHTGTREAEVPRPPLLGAARRLRRATRGGPTAAKAAGTRADPRAWVRFAARAQRAALTVPASKLYGSPALNAAAAGPAFLAECQACRAPMAAAPQMCGPWRRWSAVRRCATRISGPRTAGAGWRYSTTVAPCGAPLPLTLSRGALHPPPPPCAATPAAARQPAFFTSLTLA